MYNTNIINLTLSDDIQLDDRNVINYNRELVKTLLSSAHKDTFLMEKRMRNLAVLAQESGCTRALLEGPVHLLSMAEYALRKVGITPLYLVVNDSQSGEQLSTIEPVDITKLK